MRLLFAGFPAELFPPKSRQLDRTPLLRARARAVLIVRYWSNTKLTTCMAIVLAA